MLAANTAQRSHRCRIGSCCSRAIRSSFASSGAATGIRSHGPAASDSARYIILHRGLAEYSLQGAEKMIVMVRLADESVGTGDAQRLFSILVAIRSHGDDLNVAGFRIASEHATRLESGPARKSSI